MQRLISDMASTRTRGSLVVSSNPRNNMVKQAIASLDLICTDEAIATCLDNLSQVDDSLQEVFIHSVFNHTNIKAKKVLTQVLLKRIDRLAG